MDQRKLIVGAGGSVRPFEFDGRCVRAVANVDGDTWFVARDVAEVLGYQRARDAISQHCKGAVKHRLLTEGGEQDVTLIPERDVYRLVMRSRLPAAERFEEWVVGEVLPQIRKAGQYSIGAHVPRTLAEALRLAADQAERIEVQQKQIEEQRPAVAFAEAVRDTRDAISLGQMAAVLGLGRNRFFAMLRADRILMPDNLPYQHYRDRGYFRVVENVWFDAAHEPHPTFKTLVTGGGQVYLQKKYKEARDGV
jgi:anti-repressor protein